MKSKILIANFSLIFLIGLVSFSTAPTSLVDDVLTSTNQFRKSKGLKPLIMSEDLNAIAQQHSSNMARGRTAFGHNGFNKRYRLAAKNISGMRAFAENVAYGPTSGSEVVSMWKKSPDHRGNMLGKYSYIGIGVAQDKKGRIYYTQVFVD